MTEQMQHFSQLGMPKGCPSMFLSACFLAWFGMINQANAEVLQSISDDTVNVVIEPQVADQERHFNYRVICSPEETLDDCNSKPAAADESKPTMVVPLPDYPAEAPEPEQAKQMPQVEKHHGSHVAKSEKAGKPKTKNKAAPKKQTTAKTKTAGGKRKGKK